MKRKNTRSLSDIFSEILQESPMGAGVVASLVYESWDRVLGPSVARVCSNKEFQDGVLKVRVASALVRNQLKMQEALVVSRLNQDLHIKMVTRLILY